MIKQKVKKIGVVAMTCVLTMSSLSLVTQAAVPKPAITASMDGVAPIWDYLITISGDMQISDSGWTTVTVYCNSNYNKVTKIKAKCELQRLENSKWNTIKTWTESRNISTILYEKETAVYKGYNYRLRVTAYAYSGSTLLEQATETFDYGYYQ